jgi:pimeloyl-ACP methyl ester carboxylesterase
MPSVTNEYEKAIISATWDRLKGQVEDFVTKFDKNKPSVILILGGAASQLFRARIKFDSPPTRPDDTLFDLKWIAPGIRVQPDLLEICERDRDKGEHIVVADGAIEFCLANLHPYGKAEDFFGIGVGPEKSKEFNALEFSWDWRRNIQNAVDMLNRVISAIISRTAAKKIFLVGHSMGGMVAKLFATQSMSTKKTEYAESAQALGGIITVGTPFYGYISQLARIYDGIPEFNGYSTARNVAEIYSSFTGLYSLLPIDLDTYRSVSLDGLSAYPVMEPDGKTPTDPFKKKWPIYPPWFRVEDLSAALNLRRQLASPLLPDNLSNAVFHLRTVKSYPPTLTTATWKQEPYNCDNPSSPISTYMGEGDETIPSWSSRLASTPNDKIHIHTWDKGEHMTLMAQNFVLLTIKQVVTGGNPPSAADYKEFRNNYGENPDVASTEELEAFRKKFIGGRLPWDIPERLAWRVLQNSLM